MVGDGGGGEGEAMKVGVVSLSTVAGCLGDCWKILPRAMHAGCFF